MTSLLLCFSTIVLAFLSSWRYGVFSWEGVLLLAAVAAADRGAAAFRFFSRGERKENRPAPGYALMTGIGLVAFSAVLLLFLALREGWPLLVMGAAAMSAVLAFASRGPTPRGPWGELLAGTVAGLLLWLAAAFVFDAEGRWTWEFWWRTVLLALPSAVFIASLATVRRSCERGRPGHGVLLLPLAAYAVSGILAVFALVPWTFYLALVAGPALSAPLWRAMFRRGFGVQSGAMTAASSALMVYTLVSAAAWVTGNLLS